MPLRKCVFWPRSAADSIGLPYRASRAKRAYQSIADSSTEFQKAIERRSEVMGTERFTRRSSIRELVFEDCEIPRRTCWARWARA